MPAWTAGWRVLTRPESISGALVMAETSLGDAVRRRLCQWIYSTTQSGILNGEASLLDHLGGAARRKQAHILLDQALSEVEQAGLVVDRQDGNLLRGLGGHDRGCVVSLFAGGQKG
jgi:hypothetical protein